MPKVFRAGVVALAGLIAFLAVESARAAAVKVINDVPYKARVKPKRPVVKDPDKEDPRGRNEWFKERMGGQLTPAFNAAMVRQANKLRARYPNRMPGKTAPAGVAPWVSLGPTDANRFQNGVNNPAVDSGRLRTILPDPRPAHSDTLYVLSSGGGLWKTTNFSANKPTWVPKTDGIFATSGGSAAFGRTPDVLYVGSGDPFGPGLGGIVFKSTNGADSWGAPSFLNASLVLDLKVDTSQGTTTASDIVLVGTDNGLWRSTDGGASYAPAAFGGSAVWSLARTSAGWIASVQTFIDFFDGTGNTVLYLSTDRGATWNPVSNAGNHFPVPGTGRTTLAATPGQSVVYAFSANIDGSDQQDLYRSTNGGKDWTALHINGKTPTNPNFFNPDVNLMHGQAFYNHMVIVDPTDSTGNTVYAGGDLSSAVSRDGGQTWTLLTSWLGQIPKQDPDNPTPATPLTLPYSHADNHCAAISTASGKKIIFFGNDGGLFYSTDDGKSFQNNANEGLVDHLIYALTSGTQHTDNTLVGLQDNGTRYRLTSSTTWNGSIGGDGFGTGWSQANDGLSFGSYVFLNIFRFTQNPPNEQAKYDNLLAVSNLGGPGFSWFFDSYFVTPFFSPTAIADPVGQTFFTNTQHLILKTTDGGSSWAPIWTSPDGSAVRAVSHGVGLASDNLNFIASAVTGGRINHTTNGGATWTTSFVQASIPAWPGFNSTVAWARNHTTLYAGSESAAIGFPHIAKSVDGGNTWSDITSFLVFPVSKLVVDPSDASGNIVYAATWLGVFRTLDGGANWDLLGAGFPFCVASDLYLSPGGNFLRASTYGRGVWELPL